MSQFHTYKETLTTTTCAKTQRQLLERGPPVNLYVRACGEEYLFSFSVARGAGSLAASAGKCF